MTGLFYVALLRLSSNLWRNGGNIFSPYERRISWEDQIVVITGGPKLIMACFLAFPVLMVAFLSARGIRNWRAVGQYVSRKECHRRSTRY